MLAQIPATRVILKRGVAGFGTSRDIAKHFVAGFPARRVERVNALTYRAYIIIAVVIENDR